MGLLFKGHFMGTYGNIREENGISSPLRENQREISIRISWDLTDGILVM